MRLRLRMLLLIISSLWHKPGMIDESVLSLRVLPNDIDVTKITNDRYIALLDLGRMDLIFHLGLMRTMLRKKWVPVATFCTIRFRHPLKVFQKYLLRSRFVYWDDRTFYMQQDFERKGRIIATAYSCGTFLGKNGAVKPQDILAEIRMPVTRPDKPEIVSMLRELDETIHRGQQDKDPMH
jgi:acyl-CoA thioesterase FadM